MFDFLTFITLRLGFHASATAALDRNELSALLIAAGLGPPAEHALISLLALNGLRVSEATAPIGSIWRWPSWPGPVS